LRVCKKLVALVCSRVRRFSVVDTNSTLGLEEFARLQVPCGIRSKPDAVACRKIRSGASVVSVSLQAPGTNSPSLALVHQSRTRTELYTLDQIWSWDPADGASGWVFAVEACSFGQVRELQSSRLRTRSVVPSPGHLPPMTECQQLQFESLGFQNV
jgi:hypothetical protein